MLLKWTRDFAIAVNVALENPDLLSGLQLCAYDILLARAVPDGQASYVVKPLRYDVVLSEIPLELTLSSVPVEGSSTPTVVLAIEGLPLLSVTRDASGDVTSEVTGDIRGLIRDAVAQRYDAERV